MADTVLITLGTVLATNFGQWFFYQRKHKAAATGAEINNDRSEIENLKLIIQEWKETATVWKAMADEYRTKYIADHRAVESMGEELASVKRQLKRAQKRIATLEGRTSESLNNTPGDGATD